MATIEHNDERWMREAFEQARLATVAGEVPIGSALVGATRLIALGQTRVGREGPASHGENTLLQSLGLALWSAAHPLVLYTNVEPCLMCFGACVEAGVDRIVFSMAAPLDGGTWSANGVNQLGRRAPSITGGVLQAECEVMMRKFVEENPSTLGSQYVETLLDIKA